MTISNITSISQENDHPRFVARQTEENYFIKDVELGREFTIVREQIENDDDFIDDEWIDETKETPLPYFNLNNHLIVIILSDFKAAGKFASGKDLFINYNPGMGTIKTFLISEEAVRGRNPGPCRGALDTFYVIADFNNDGNNDIGVVKEEIKCDWVDDMPVSSQYFIQYPVNWYLWEVDHWRYDQDLEGKKPPSFQIITTMYPGSVDVTGQALWRYYNPLKWKLFKMGIPVFWPCKRLEKSKEEAIRKGDMGMVEKLSMPCY